VKRLSLAICVAGLLALAALVLLREKSTTARAPAAPSWNALPAGGVPVVGAPIGELGQTPIPVAVAPATVDQLKFGAASVADPTGSTGDALSAWGPPPAPQLDPRRFSEAHWQGLELIPKTAALTKALKLPQSVQGVIVDDASLPADLQGFVAGDVVIAIERIPTPNLTRFIQATDAVRDRRSAALSVYRQGSVSELVLTALLDRLGTANGETPGMIPASARSPHPYQGPCTTCHRIGSNGALAADQGDTIFRVAPAISVTATAPHRDRGTCSACHQVLP
jgi:hypothetical protein